MILMESNVVILGKNGVGKFIFFRILVKSEYFDLGKILINKLMFWFVVFVIGVYL